MTETLLPKPYCAVICRNAMTDLCLGHCASERKGRWFELRKDLTIQDMPRFPIDQFVNDMTADERKIILGSYTAKLVDQAQGYNNEPTLPPIRRQNIYSASSGEVSSVVQVKDVLHDLKEAISPLQSEQECENTGVPTETVDQSAD